MFSPTHEDLEEGPLPQDVRTATLSDYARHWSTLSLPLTGLPHLKRVVTYHTSPALLEILRAARSQTRANIDCSEGLCGVCDNARQFCKVLTRYIHTVETRLYAHR